MTYNILSAEQIPVAVAIIYHKDKYLMQLRDDIPTIFYPGVWGLFGGHLDPGEEPEAGLKRELLEEIDYSVDCLTEFRCYADSKIFRHVYSCQLSVPVWQLNLKEGWDMGLLTVEEIKRGSAYSNNAKQERSLGDIHRQIMLDFIAAQKS
ncbi:MAG: NUDIX domain-containing protein [Cyanobacteria bacterium P01_G01_bin.19]